MHVTMKTEITLLFKKAPRVICSCLSISSAVSAITTVKGCVEIDSSHIPWSNIRGQLLVSVPLHPSLQRATFRTTWLHLNMFMSAPAGLTGEVMWGKNAMKINGTFVEVPPAGVISQDTLTGCLLQFVREQGMLGRVGLVCCRHEETYFLICPSPLGVELTVVAERYLEENKQVFNVNTWRTVMS